jgi:hypothetical protein
MDPTMMPKMGFFFVIKDACSDIGIQVQGQSADLLDDAWWAPAPLPA